MAGHAKTLNPRQALFCQHLVPADGAPSISYTEAAIRAGYKNSPYLPEAAGRLAQLPLIRAEIARLQTIARASLILSAEQWRIAAADYYRRALKQNDLANVGRALDLNGKHLGLLDTKADNANAALATRLMEHLAALSDVAPVLPSDAVDGEYRALPPSA